MVTTHCREIKHHMTSQLNASAAQANVQRIIAFQRILLSLNNTDNITDTSASVTAPYIVQRTSVLDRGKQTVYLEETI